MIAFSTKQTVWWLDAHLSSPRRHSLARAQALLVGLGPHGAAFLTQRLADDLHARRKTRGHLRGLLGLFVALCALSPLFHPAGAVAFHGNAALLFLLSVLLARAIVVCCCQQCATRRRIQREVLLLQRHARAEQIALLIEVMRESDLETSCQAQRLLVQTLPLLNEESALTPAHHAALCRVFRGTNISLILAVLGAFTKMGTAASLPAVRRMTACPVWMTDRQRIQAAAIICQTALETRAHQEEIRQTSLRPATFTACDPTLLLRAGEKQ